MDPCPCLMPHQLAIHQLCSQHLPVSDALNIVLEGLFDRTLWKAAVSELGLLCNCMVMTKERESLKTFSIRPAVETKAHLTAL